MVQAGTFLVDGVLRLILTWRLVQGQGLTSRELRTQFVVHDDAELLQNHSRYCLLKLALVLDQAGLDVAEAAKLLTNVHGDGRPHLSPDVNVAFHLVEDAAHDGCVDLVDVLLDAADLVFDVRGKLDLGLRGKALDTHFI